MFRARILSCIAYLLITVWCWTIRLSFVNKDIPDKLIAEGKNVIYAFWHGRQFLLLYSHRRLGIILPASESRDGEIIARILLRFGYDVVRGSSKRKGARALLGLVDCLRRGKNISLTVDGPRGPVHQVKQGAPYLAGKLDKPIIPVSMSARRYWILTKSWDKTLIPVPFTRGVVVYGEPIIVSGVSDEELESSRLKLQDALTRTTARADSFFST